MVFITSKNNSDNQTKITKHINNIYIKNHTVGFFAVVNIGFEIIGPPFDVESVPVIVVQRGVAIKRGVGWLWCTIGE